MVEFSIQLGMEEEQLKKLRSEVKKHLYLVNDTYCEEKIKDYFVCEFKNKGDFIGVAVVKSSQVQPKSAIIEIFYFFKVGILGMQKLMCLAELDKYFAGIHDTEGNGVRKDTIRWVDNSTKVKNVLF